MSLSLIMKNEPDVNWKKEKGPQDFHDVLANITIEEEGAPLERQACFVPLPLLKDDLISHSRVISHVEVPPKQRLLEDVVVEAFDLLGDAG